MAEFGLSEAEQRFGLAPGQFGFASRYVTIGGIRLHYVDEGSGPAVVLVHGNPTWSFLYRRIIAALKSEYRCVAFDLAGFGLSDAPADFSYLPQDHAQLLAGALDLLDIRDATLVGHDWGGPIGLGAMAATKGRLTRLALGNTWAWPVNGDFHFEWFSKLLGGPAGRFAADRFAIFVNGVMPSSMRRRPLTADEMKAYRAPFEGRTRKPMHVMPWAITGASAWLGALEKQVRGYTGPVHFIWPENDIAFRDKELARWRSYFPQAGVTRISRCGHFLWEDAPDEALAALRTALN